jgi:hypothetical protein
MQVMLRTNKVPSERIYDRTRTMKHIAIKGVRNENAEMEFMNPVRTVRLTADSTSRQ